MRRPNFPHFRAFYTVVSQRKFQTSPWSWIPLLWKPFWGGGPDYTHTELAILLRQEPQPAGLWPHLPTEWATTCMQPWLALVIRCQQGTATWRGTWKMRKDTQTTMDPEEDPISLSLSLSLCLSLSLFLYLSLALFLTLGLCSLLFFSLFLHSPWIFKLSFFLSLFDVFFRFLVIFPCSPGISWPCKRGNSCFLEDTKTNKHHTTSHHKPNM